MKSPLLPTSRSAVIALLLALPAAAAPDFHDVVVYGGTSGGVVAAVQVARSGKSVVLISPTAHLGGLTTSGLGWTDLGRKGILGGISREFYQMMFTHYGKSAAWNHQPRESYANRGQGAPAFDENTRTASVFEPKVAEAAFKQLVAGRKVPVVTGRLDLKKGVTMDGGAIRSLRLEDGREFTGRMFIDASYEGDLLPGAGVTHVVGREANAAYGETSSGIQTARATQNQLPNGIDPHVRPGDPSSGLLPGVNADAGGPDGGGDARLQAYCYRMVLTDVPENRVAVAKPAAYQEADYELLFRAIEAGQKSGFFKLDLMPNRKTDSNNTGGISTDFIGKNHGPGWNWATLGHDQREALAKQHENWQRGLLWTLQNHPRVPETIRKKLAPWGLPADEFTDNGHWPWQLYVREARRMVSDVVMTQQHCTGIAVVPDPVGLASYSMDSHNTQRIVINGMVKNEGDVQVHVPRPYPVSYRAIVPKTGECGNLLVPWSLSASHMAFGSIRMEPVFMILSQSAAIAAVMAIDSGLKVQQVPYPELRRRLLECGQVLGQDESGRPATVIDNGDPALVKVTGEWISGNSTPGFAGKDYFHDQHEGMGTKEVFYQIPDGMAGRLRVSLRWTAHPNRASNTTVEIRHQDGTATLKVNQRENGGTWNAAGSYRFSGAKGEGVKILNQDADGHVIADAIGLTPDSGG